jgi:hypothetical protein
MGRSCHSLSAVVSTGRRNTLIFEQRWSVQYEVSSSHLLFSVTTR